MLLLGLDPALRNLGVVTFDGHTMRGSKIDLPLCLVDDQWYLRTVKPMHYAALVEEFMVGNASTLAGVTCVGIENQYLGWQIKLADEFRDQFLAKGIRVRMLAPQRVRAFFGTSVPGQSAEEGYKERKEKSVAKLKELVSAADWTRLDDTFGNKKDDIADAAMLALYMYHNPDTTKDVLVSKRTHPSTQLRHLKRASGPRIKRLTFQCPV
jgi:hypothetical protein